MNKYHDVHDFKNYEDETVLVMLEPGDVVEVRDGSRPLDVSVYDGEEFGNEVEVPAGASMRVIKFA